MSLVALSSVRREIGAQVILDEVRASIAAGERIGLVGPNGAGKTTLLKLVAGREMPDRGTVQRARGVRIDLLAQESAHDPDLLGARTIAEAVRRGAREAIELGESLRAMELDGRAASPEYATARQRFDAMDG